MSDAAEGRSASDRGNSDSGPSSSGWGGLNSGDWGGGWSSNGNNSAQNPNAVADPTDMASVDKALRDLGYDPVGTSYSAGQIADYGIGMMDPGMEVYSAEQGRVRFDQLDPAKQEQYSANVMHGLPGFYDAANKGFREKVVDGMNWGLDKTGLLGRALKDLGVKPGMTFSEERGYEKTNPGAAEARYSRMNDIASGVANMVMPGPMKLGINFAKNIENGMSLADAAKLSVGDLAKSYAVGAVNKAAMPEIAKAIGIDGVKALNTYNQAAALANSVGAGVPTVPSPGAAVVGSLFGPPSGAPNINASGQPMTDLQGDRMYGGVTAGGWSSGGGSSGYAPAAPAAPAPANVIEEITQPGRTLSFDGAGMGRAIRAGAQKRSFR